MQNVVHISWEMFTHEL